MAGAETAERVVATAHAFAREVVAPAAAAWERERRLPLETFRDAADAGLCRLFAPEERGGHGLGPTAAAAVLRELAAADLAFAFCLVVHNNLIATICRYGADDAIHEHLPPLVRGERLGAFLLTEPSAGSDAAALRTTARRDGGAWVLDGEKAWVTNATHADVLSVYAQTDPAAGSRGIACFLVDADQPGVVRTPAYELLGCHATGTAGFRFEGCRVDDAQLLIPPGQAFRAAMGGIDLARVLVAAMCVGVLSCALEAALAYAEERRVFGERLADLQGLRWLLADTATDLEAARGLVRAATEALEDGADADRRRRARQEVRDEGRPHAGRRLHAGARRQRLVPHVPARAPPRGGEDDAVPGRDHRDPERRDRPGPDRPRLTVQPAQRLAARPNMMPATRRIWISSEPSVMR